MQMARTGYRRAAKVRVRCHSLPKKGGSTNRSRAEPSNDSLWHRLYQAALLELDPELLPSRVHAAKTAIETEIVELHKAGEAGELWSLMGALSVLDDLPKNE